MAGEADDQGPNSAAKSSLIRSFQFDVPQALKLLPEGCETSLRKLELADVVSHLCGDNAGMGVLLYDHIQRFKKAIGPLKRMRIKITDIHYELSRRSHDEHPLFCVYALHDDVTVLTGTSLDNEQAREILFMSDLDEDEFSKFPGVIGSERIKDDLLQSKWDATRPTKGSWHLHIWTYQYNGDEEELQKILKIFTPSHGPADLGKAFEALRAALENRTDPQPLLKQLFAMLKQGAEFLPPEMQALASPTISLADSIIQFALLLSDMLKRTKFVGYEELDPKSTPVSVKMNAPDARVKALTMNVQFTVTNPAFLPNSKL